MRYAARFYPALVILGTTAIVTALGGCTTIKHHYESALLLADIQAGQGESRLKSITKEPARTTVVYRGRAGSHVADIYEPADREPRGTLVLLHGFTEAGRRDARVKAFAQSMARTGFVVVAPDLEGPRSFAVGRDDVHDIRDALRFVAAGADGRAQGPVGLVAVSFTAGPAVLAAIESEVDHLVLIGGYYDLRAAITYAITGYDPLSGEADATPAVRPEGRWLVLRVQLQHLEDAEDRELLRGIAQRRLANPEAEVAGLVAQLSSQGEVIYELVTANDPEKVRERIAMLPESARRELCGLDLAGRELEDLDAEVVLIHGRDDPVIPVTHSLHLRRNLPTARTHLYTPQRLHHVEVAPGWGTTWELWRAGARLLELTHEPD